MLHSVSDSSSMRAKRGDAWAKCWDRDGGDVRSRRHGYTRLRKYEREKARAKTDSGGVG